MRRAELDQVFAAGLDQLTESPTPTPRERLERALSDWSAVTARAYREGKPVPPNIAADVQAVGKRVTEAERRERDSGSARTCETALDLWLQRALAIVRREAVPT